MLGSKKGASRAYNCIGPNGNIQITGTPFIFKIQVIVQHQIYVRTFNHAKLVDDGFNLITILPSFYSLCLFFNRVGWLQEERVSNSWLSGVGFLLYFNSHYEI